MRRFLSSLQFAIRGVRAVFRVEQNFRIQVGALLLVLMIAATLGIRPWEYVAIVLVGGAVLVLECINSAVERLLDLLKPRLHGYVSEIKDIMAAAVLIAAIAGAVIGIIILGPYIV